MTMRKAVTAAVLALCVGLAAPASAQPAAPSRGVQIAHLLLQRLDLRAMIAKQMGTASNGAFGFTPQRPEWGRLMTAAIADEVESGRPVLERLIGQRLDQKLSPDEIEAGQVIVGDPAIQEAI